MSESWCTCAVCKDRGHVGSDSPSFTPELSKRRAFDTATCCLLALPAATLLMAAGWLAEPLVAPALLLRFVALELVASRLLPTCCRRTGAAAAIRPLPAGALTMLPPWICCRRAASARSCAWPSPNDIKAASCASSADSGSSGTVSGSRSACRRASVAFASFLRSLQTPIRYQPMQLCHTNCWQILADLQHASVGHIGVRFAESYRMARRNAMFVA
jgi:hypothetical protein